MKSAKESHYTTLGLNSSATIEEIRRAYRILARRYHPDLNPEAGSENRFKAIAEAYRVLSDPVRRKQYDLEVELDGGGLGVGARQFKEAQKRAAFGSGAFSGAASRRHSQGESGATAARGRAASDGQEFMSGKEALFGYRPRQSSLGGLKRVIDVGREIVLGLFAPSPSRNKGERVASTAMDRGSPAPQTKSTGASLPARLSIIEVSVTVKDSLRGVKKTIEVEEPNGPRKISVRIPAGVRNGSVVRLRGKGENSEELILIMRLAHHPWLSVHTRGVVMEVPITPAEAINGANITVPTLEDQVVVKVPPGAQSGQELRVKGKGIADSKNGERGDLFVRVMIRVPECVDAFGIREKAAELDRYFERGVRSGLPSTLDQI